MKISIPDYRADGGHKGEYGAAPGLVMMTDRDAPARALRRDLGLLVPAELAAALSVTEKTLQTWRSKKYGPPATPIGKQIFYQIADVLAWLATHRQLSV